MGSDAQWDPISSDVLKDAELRAAVAVLSSHCECRPRKVRTSHRLMYIVSSNIIQYMYEYHPISYSNTCMTLLLPSADPGMQSSASAQQALRQYGIPLWATEEFSTFSDESGALCWIRAVVDDWVTGYMTMTSSW